MAGGNNFTELTFRGANLPCSVEVVCLRRNSHGPFVAGSSWSPEILEIKVDHFIKKTHHLTELLLFELKNLKTSHILLTLDNFACFSDSSIGVDESVGLPAPPRGGDCNHQKSRGSVVFFCCRSSLLIGVP